MKHSPDSYEKAGVKSLDKTMALESGLSGLSYWIRKTFSLNTDYQTLLDLGYFANVIKITPEIDLAISTDGVGTKLLVAEMMNKYDTVGIDLMAMCVNDLICVGAEPCALVDYIGVQIAEGKFLEEIAKGLYEGARLAKVSIPGGEVAQLGGMIRGIKSDSGFDLVGTAIGILKNRKPILGEEVSKGDVIIGLSSNGLHSNGYTLVRKILFDKKGYKIDQYLDDLGRTIGEELLEPTHIYVQEILEILDSGIPVKALINITGDGLFNIKRIANKKVGFVIEDLMEVPPIFDIIKKDGKISIEEMYKIFNMGMGFCIITNGESDNSNGIIDIVKKHGKNAKVIGNIIEDPENRIKLAQLGYISKEDRFIEV
jgi:phosphoribosylformylglycinamidine cyclo-ligase